MSRYIDADDVANAIYHHFPSIRTMADARGIIEEAPSIDIVRCKECRWSRPRTLKGETGYRCVFYRIYKAENGHCDIGEREGE